MPRRPTPSLIVRAAILAAIAFGGLVACDADAPPSASIGGHPATLAGTSWAVVAVGGQRPPVGSRPTIAFDGGRVQGSGGCNGFGGAYRYDPTTGALGFDQLGMTLIGCENAIGLFESRLFAALGSTNGVVLLPDGTIALSGAGGDIVLAAAGPTVTD